MPDRRPGADEITGVPFAPPVDLSEPSGDRVRAIRLADEPLGLTVDEIVLHELYVLTHANGKGPLVVKLIEILSIDRDVQKVNFCEPGGRVDQWSLSGVGLVAYHGGWSPTNRIVTPATWLERNPDPMALTETAATLHRLLTDRLAAR
jgi:hypothetical protein